MSRPLFTSGTARGGTNLLAKALSVNDDIKLSSDPYLPIFRQFRNAILLNSNDPEIVTSLDPESPIDDYYFSRIKLRMMEHIQRSSVDIPYHEKNRSKLLEALDKRTRLSSADLIPYFDLLSGRTFTELFNKALDVVEKARKAKGDSWVGFNENWALEFFRPLARAFPQARFIIILRDPRAAIASALREKDPAKVPHVLSFTRAWRKYVALTIHFRQDPLFENRLFVLTYEELVRDPEGLLKKIASFLDVTFDSAMLNAENFRDPQGGKWKPNTHLDAPSPGIFQSSIDAWRTYLPPEIVETVEFICDPDMQVVGYRPSVYETGAYPSGDCLQFIAKDSRDCQGWRTDFGDMERDMGSELLRKAILQVSSAPPEAGLIERCFLFKEVFDVLRANEASTPAFGLSGAYQAG